MDIPANVKVHEHGLASFWLDENGILNVISKPATRTIESMTDYFNCVKRVTGNKKVYVISDVTTASPLDKQTREFVNNEMSESYHALALISNSPVGRMIANIVFTLNTATLPIRMFSNEKEAREWLKKLKAAGEK